MVLGNLSGFISSTHTRTQHRSTLNVIPAEILNLIFNRVSRFHPFSYFSQFLFGTLLKGKALFLKKLLIKSKCQRFFNIFKMLDFSKHQIQENVQISFLAKKALESECLDLNPGSTTYSVTLNKFPNVSIKCLR